jgi:hypothetical protein
MFEANTPRCFKKSDNKSVVYLRISEDNGFLIISIEENQIHRLNQTSQYFMRRSRYGQDDDVEEIEKRMRFQVLDNRCRTQNT